MSWLWDSFQQRQIRDGQLSADKARIDAKVNSRSIAELEERVDRLSLLCHALFEELQRTTGFSEDQLRGRMVEIDLRDGKADGKYSPGVSEECSECGHKNKRRRPNCYWCGNKLAHGLDHFS